MRKHRRRPKSSRSRTQANARRPAQTWASRIGRRALIFAGPIVAAGILLTLPLRWIDPPATAFMLQDDSRVTTLTAWRSFDTLGGNMVLAVIAAEDQRFAEHWGLDLSSIRTAVEKRRDGQRLRGASTITQQLAKNLYLWPGRSFLRKGLEAWLAVNLELFLPKRRILELYLNVVEFGPGIYGATEASMRFFGKESAALRDQEAALLAAVLPSPRRYRADAPTPYLTERQSWILTQMARLERERWIDRVR